MIWVELVPADRVDDDFFEDAGALTRSVAKATRSATWLVHNNDSGGCLYLAVDSTGARRWRQLDAGAWQERLWAQLERRGLELSSPKGAKLEAIARSRSPLGRLEADVGIRWDSFFDVMGSVRRGRSSARAVKVLAHAGNKDAAHADRRGGR